MSCKTLLTKTYKSKGRRKKEEPFFLALGYIVDAVIIIGRKGTVGKLIDKIIGPKRIRVEYYRYEADCQMITSLVKNYNTFVEYRKDKKKMYNEGYVVKNVTITTRPGLFGPFLRQFVGPKIIVEYIKESND